MKLENVGEGLAGGPIDIHNTGILSTLAFMAAGFLHLDPLNIRL
jgi:hypothetical protein